VFSRKDTEPIEHKEVIARKKPMTGTDDDFDRNTTRRHNAAPHSSENRKQEGRTTMNRNQKRSTLGLVLAAGMAFGSGAQASYDALLETLEQNEAITSEQADTLRDQAPKYRVRPASGVVKDLQIRGRVQAQFGYVDASNDEGSDDFSTFEVRRARIGLRGTLFDSVRAQVEANLVPGSDLSMRSAFLQWREHKPAYVKLGYDKPHSSLEENTSSAKILTVERSVINGLVAAPGPVTGLSLDGVLGIASYGVGVYTDRDNRNAGGATAKYLYNAMAALSLDDMVGGHTLRLQGVYLASDDEEGNVGAKFDDVVTAAAHLAVNRFDLRAEYFMGDNDGVETKGFYVMPSIHLTERLQAVLRFEQAEADKSGGIRAPSRYVRDVPALKVRETTDDAGDVISKVDPQAGDEYQSVYVGLNYYISGHGHKIMAGVEVAELNNTGAGDLEATTFTTAWRMLF
jgi:phosphate-selective porin OprO and OprP